MGLDYFFHTQFTPNALMQIFSWKWHPKTPTWQQWTEQVLL